MKIKLNDLKRVFREEVLARRYVLREADEAPVEEPTLDLLPSDSLDDQIDERLIEFEKLALPESGMQEHYSLKRHLLEADEEEEEELEAEPTEEVTPEPTKSIEARTYAKHVARMVENYTSLFDIGGTLLRRSLNYVKTHYGEESAEQVREILEVDYKLSTDPTDVDIDNNPPPAAAGAGADVGGV